MKMKFQSPYCMNLAGKTAKKWMGIFKQSGQKIIAQLYQNTGDGITKWEGSNSKIVPFNERI